MAIAGGVPEVREQREVAFPGWFDRGGKPLTTVAVLTTDGRRWVPFTFLVKQVLGMDDVAQQRERIYAHAVLSRRMAQMRIQTKGGAQLAHMLELRAVGFYLGTVSLARVRAEARDRLLDFQEQAVDALDRLFFGEVPSVQPVPTAPQVVQRFESLERFAIGLAGRVGRLEAAQPFTLDEEA